jgi:uncharacterized coiled-coil DUF342 family protein
MDPGPAQLHKQATMLRSKAEGKRRDAMKASQRAGSYSQSNQAANATNEENRAAQLNQEADLLERQAVEKEQIANNHQQQIGQLKNQMHDVQRQIDNINSSY